MLNLFLSSLFISTSAASAHFNLFDPYFKQFDEQKCVEGSRFANLEDCKSYFQYKGGRLYRQTCPEDEIFWDRLGECTSMVRHCDQPKCIEGQTEFAISKDRRIQCDEYQVCEFGDWKTYQCPQNEIFDIQTKECVQGTCKKSSTPPKSNYGIEDASNAGKFYSDWSEQSVQFEKYIAKTCQGRIVLPDRNDCRRFWECSFGGYFVATMCSRGYVFNSQKNQCVIGNKCEKDREICLPGQFLPTETCGEYKFCTDNKWKSGFCDENLQFFNGACGPKKCVNPYIDVEYAKVAECRHDDIKGDENNVDGYSYCYYGKWTRRQCPNGYHFDWTKYHCVARRTTEPLPTPVCYIGQRREIVGDRHKYEECDGNKWWLQYCAYGLVFQNGYCVRENNPPTSCVESEGAANYRDVPHNCHAFYQCAQGRWVKQPCAPGTVWNDRITTCDFPRNVPHCGGSNIFTHVK